MKRCLAALAALALAAAPIGCVQSAPASSQSGAVPVYDSARLEDGRLRLLYAADGAGGTLLRGGEVVCRAGSADSLGLLDDLETGETAGYCHSWNDAGARRTAVYDADGALLWVVVGYWSAWRAGESLVLASFAGGYGQFGAEEAEFRLLDLAAGTESVLPADTTGCIPTSTGQLVLGVRSETQSEDGYYGSTVRLQSSDGSVLFEFENGTAYPLSDGWVGVEQAIQGADGGTSWATTLCQPSTGAVIENYRNDCGAGLVCTETADGRYAVRRLDDPALLAVFDAPCSLYMADGTALLGTVGSEVLRSPDGAETAGRCAYFGDDGRAAILSADSTLLFYDAAAGSVTASVALPARDAAQVYVGDLGGGCALLCYADESYNTLFTEVYAAGDLLFSTGGTDCKYDYIRYLAAGVGGPVFAASYSAPGSYNSLCDVLGADGSVLLSGLGWAYRAADLPAGCFTARRGFDYGYMDLAGDWLYCESVFSSLSAEDDFHPY